jgi:uncharacterized protein (DUF2141 family)
MSRDTLHAFSRRTRIRSAGRLLFAGLLAAGAWAVPIAAPATELVVRVTGVTAPAGRIGCSLFTGPAGFPMDTTGMRVVWLPADPKGVSCRFADVASGAYAVAIVHDTNGNGRVDTNFVGLPTEQWGVSRNVRPSLRAPRFDEASIRLAAGAEATVIDIEVAR